MKNTLKRAWASTGTMAFFHYVMAALVIVLAASWYELHDEYDISTMMRTDEFQLGIAVALTVFVLALAASGITYSIADRRLPKDPLPIDPDLPPTQMVYIQGEGEPELCACHDEPIKDGAPIWHWPQPAKLVCAKEYDAA